MIEVSDRIEFFNPGPRAKLTRGTVVGFVNGLKLRVRADVGGYYAVAPDYARKLAPSELRVEIEARTGPRK